MTLSIVIPTYNGARYVEAAILSALCQTYPVDEIVVSDDNSTDNTLALCERYVDRVKIFKNPDGPSGFVNGWNNAIAKASGDYIAILHQDDVLHPTFVEEIRQAICLHPDVKHFFVPCCYIDGSGDTIKSPDYCDNNIKRYTGAEYVSAYQRVGTPHIHRCPGVVTHRSIFDLCCYREEAGHIADDDFFYRVGQFTDVVGVLKPLASYRLHSSSETGNLADVELVKRLIRDYSFQLKHIGENSIFTNANIQFFKQHQRKYIKRYFGYCIRRGDLLNAVCALKYLFK